jgi:hypothetical protein
VKTAGSTVRTSLTSHASWATTLGDPYSRVLGSARKRSAISRWTMTNQVPSEGRSAMVRSRSGVATE